MNGNANFSSPMSQKIGSKEKEQVHIIFNTTGSRLFDFKFCCVKHHQVFETYMSNTAVKQCLEYHTGKIFTL